jgi:hypothetical protein
MKMKNNHIIGLLAIVGLATAMAWYSGAYVGNAVAGSSDGVLGQKLTYNAQVIVSVNGKVWAQGHNTLQTFGRDLIVNRLAGGVGSAVNNISVGNTTGVTTINELVGEINASTGCPAFGAVADTVLKNNPQSNGNWTITQTYTADCPNVVVNYTALSNGTSGVNKVVFANFSFTPVTLQTNDQLNVTWVIYVV